MSLAIVYTRAAIGVQAPLVTVETHLSYGLPGFAIVGLPETAVKESKDRVRSAIINSQFDFPVKKILVNLAPADLPKEGGRYDLPIALGILAASNQIPKSDLKYYEFAGELALSGHLRAIKGTLPFAIGTRLAKRTLILPIENAPEASLPGDNLIMGAKSLSEVAQHLKQKKRLSPYENRFDDTPKPDLQKTETCDLNAVCGQPHARRALEIAATGGHSLLMIGPPGTGKTMLASRLPGILPPLTREQALEVVAIHSLNHSYNALKLEHANWKKRPFRAPHHTASSVALVGGGSKPRPGEISLAHHGVLFLDELPEFDRKVLEVLREPLESGHIVISRASRQAEFPAEFQLIAAMNPCPCGHLGNPKQTCVCSEDQIKRYRAKLSGPLLDRIDMQIEVPALKAETLASANTDNESSACVSKRVLAARAFQQKRNQLTHNAKLSNTEIMVFAKLNEASRLLFKTAMERLNFSARSYHRILRIARTIADLDAANEVNTQHLKEALTFRKLDRRYG